MTAIDCLIARSGHAAVHRDGPDDAPRCLLVPPFGVPASALQLLASAIADEGWAALRLDPRNHVGLGTGEIVDFELSRFVSDCRRAVERYRPDVVVAVSMGARAAMRALALVPHRPPAILLLPVVDVRATLQAILGRDWFAVEEAQLPHLMPVLGQEVDAARFRRDCVRHEMVSVDGTRRDLAALGDTVLLPPGLDDPWVELSMVEQLVASVGGAPRPVVRPVPCDRHDLHVDPDLALRLLSVVLDEVRAVLGSSGVTAR